MYSALNAGAIGVKTADLDEGLAAAKLGGFEGLEVSADELRSQVDSQGAEAVKAKFETAGIRPAGWGLPISWNAETSAFQESLQKLDRLAEAASAVGCTRCFTFISPVSNDKPFDENRALHVDRFSQIASVLAKHGCTIGLEFIGPKTIRDSAKYEFIYTLGGMLSMCRDVGPNAGLLLDCWHWYTSGGTLAEVEALKASDVVYVHVNDAPDGIHVDSQIDSNRRLPGQTGVIDIAGFLRALEKIGYDGPIVAEPFYKELGNLASDEERLKLVGDSVKKIFAAV